VRIVRGQLSVVSGQQRFKRIEAHMAHIKKLIGTPRQWARLKRRLKKEAA